jgi:NAD+ synthase (glutamine-hydrolysing)
MADTHGFVRVAAAVPQVRVADTGFNAAAAIALLQETTHAGAHVIVFPELHLTGATCGDLFQQPALQAGALNALAQVCTATRDCSVMAVLGLPLVMDGQLFNCAVAIQNGAVLGVVPKTFIPGDREHHEPRWFAPGTRMRSACARLNGMTVPCGTDLLFHADDLPGLCVGVELCEDLWAPQPPSTTQALMGATVLVNLSAGIELVGKAAYRRTLVQQQSARCLAAYVMAGAGVHESTTDAVYSGHALIAENGECLTETARFQRAPELLIADIDLAYLARERQIPTSFRQASGDGQAAFRSIAFQAAAAAWQLPIRRAIATHPFVPEQAAERDERYRDIFAMQTAGLAKRLEHCGLQQVVLGVSGGLDSTLALLVCVKTFDLLGLDRQGINAVSLPGYGTSPHTRAIAQQLCAALGVPLREIDIRPACDQHLRDIGHDRAARDVIYENVQARERTQLLMNLANQRGALHIGTGDLSELALGWCTFNGDQMAMYSVNCGIPKTLVICLVQWAAETATAADARTALQAVLTTPISPELLPPDAAGAIAQKTEETIGPYELHDFFLYHALRRGAPPRTVRLLASQAFATRYTPEEITRWLRVFYNRFFTHQFKRSCLPDGPKIGSVCLSPRTDWRMPSDAVAATWLEELA